MRAQQKGGKMKTRIVDSEITLIRYYRNDAVSLPWYQDPDVVKQVDDRDTPYDVAIVICKAYQNRRIGRRCVQAMLQLAQEKGMCRVKANIYSFNTQSQKMFQSVGFTKTAPEWYEYTL